MSSQSVPIQGVFFEPCPILKLEADGTDLKTLDMKVSEAFAASYLIPGQYVQIKIGDNKPSFFAIASPPDGRQVFSFLIKETANNQWLTNALEGSIVEISNPQGKGFQISNHFDKYQYDFPATNIYLLACGSGIAPIAAAIESNILGLQTIQKNSLFARTATLYIGARSHAHLPFQNKYQQWESLGVTIIPVLSAADDKWNGKKGYIQQALAEDKVNVPRNSGALLCGQRGMADATREILLSAGVFEARILQNF